MFWKKVDKTKKTGLAFTLFGSQSLVPVEEEPIHVCSCGSASDLFLVCVKTGAINIYSTNNGPQSSPRLLCTINPMNPLVLALACFPPPHFAVVTVEPENPHSAINVVRIYRPPPNTPELLPYLRTASNENGNDTSNKNTVSMYELPMHASVTSITVCAATGRLAVVTQGDITIWAPEPDPSGHTPIYDKIMHIYVPDVKKVAIYRYCLAYCSDFRVRVLEFSIVKERSALTQSETSLSSSSNSADSLSAESSAVRLQGGPTGIQDSEYFLSICSGRSSSAIPVANFGAKKVKRDDHSTTSAVRFGPTSEVGISVKLDPQYAMRSVQLLVYARYPEIGGPINTLELLPEYLYLSPPGGSPYALREVGLRCFTSTSVDGHLYNISQPKELAYYKYCEAITSCCMGEELLYAMSVDGVEAFPLRTSMNAAEYTNVPSPCSMGFKTFLGPKALTVAGQRLILLTKLYDPSVPEPPPITPLTPPTSSSSSSVNGKKHRVDKRGRPIPDVSWNTYVLTPYDAEALHEDMVAQAKDATTKNAYYSLILEDHFLLQAEIVSLKKVIAARYDGKEPGEDEATELKKRKALLAQSSGYLGDYFLKTNEFREAAQCFSVSDKQIAEVVNLFTVSVKTPRPELLEYLDRVLFDPSIDLSSDENKNVADAILRYYAEFAPHRLSTIILDSHLSGYSREGALLLLHLVPKLLFNSEKVRKALLDSQQIPQVTDNAENVDEDSRMAFIDPQDFLPKDLIAQALLCNSLGRKKTAIKILSGIRPEHVVDLCVSNPSLLDPNIQNSLARPLREVAPYAVLEALETLSPANSFTLPAALDADTSMMSDANDTKAFLSMLYFESKLVPLAPASPSTSIRPALAREASSDCAESLALLYLEKILAHPGREEIQMPLETEEAIRKRLESNKDECFNRALLEHQKAFISCRPTWLDNAVPFSFHVNESLGDDISIVDEIKMAAYFDYTHFYTKKLEGLICSGLLYTPIKLADTIRSAISKHENEAKKAFCILLALVLPILPPTETEPRSTLFSRFVELEPTVALDFGMYFCTSSEDWTLVMEAVLKRAEELKHLNEKANSPQYEDVLESYRNLLDYVSCFFEPEEFIGMLPKTGSIEFFMEYIEKSCQQQVAGDMRKTITCFLAEKEII